MVGCEFKSCYRQCVVNLGKSLYLACSFDPSTLGIWTCLGEYHYLSADRFARPCLLKIPAVLQITLLKIFRCAVGVYFVSLELCMTLSDLGGLKIAHLKTILGVWLCAIALACLKRQGLVCTNNWPLAANSLLKGHWTTSASSPNFFQKSWDFYIIFISLEVYTYVVTAC